MTPVEHDGPREWLSLLLQQYRERGTVVEKYDVVPAQQRSERRYPVRYRSNEAGFGWTNGVFTVLFDELPADQQRRLMAKSVGAR